MTINTHTPRCTLCCSFHSQVWGIKQ